jgi:hypothetical protein
MVEKGRRRLTHYTFRDSAAQLREAIMRVLDRARSGTRVRPPAPRISVLLDLADPGAKAAGALAALLRQGHTDFEIIPFGGTVPAELAEDPRIRIPKAGPQASPAEAAAEVSGDVRVLVRGDCRLAPTTLERIAAEFADHPECDIVAVPTVIDSGQSDDKRGWTMPLSDAEAELSAGDRRLLPTLSFERRILKDAGRDYRGSRPLIAWRERIAAYAGSFEGTLAYAYDADYYVRLVEAGGAVRVLPDPLVAIAISADPAAARYWFLVMGELQKIVTARRGRLRGRFFRLYRHRQRGLEPVATKKWDLLLSLQAWVERPLWAARRRLGKRGARSLLLSGMPPVA